MTVDRESGWANHLAVKPLVVILRPGHTFT
jgi:hypothetical protein